jgi:hypothetical protein
MAAYRAAATARQARRYVKCCEQDDSEASPTACIVDSQSVKSAEKGGQHRRSWVRCWHPDRAIIWFRHQPMAGYDGRTALERREELDLLAVDKIVGRWCRPRSSGISYALRIICRAKPTGAAPKSPATLPAAATRRAGIRYFPPPRPPELVHRLLHLLGLLAGGVEVVLQALDAVAQRVSSDALPVSALLCPVRPAPLGHHGLFQQVGTLTLTVRPSLGHPTHRRAFQRDPPAVRPIRPGVLPDSRGHPLRPADRSAARSLHFVRANLRSHVRAIVQPNGRAAARPHPQAPAPMSGHHCQAASANRADVRAS